ncbi:hypothetical protein G9A89_001261 [Geosiphon pyriformis]|nr:hypothetical protein G9A89_001261 [Geosiphon pyriformis]
MTPPRTPQVGHITPEWIAILINTGRTSLPIGYAALAMAIITWIMATIMVVWLSCGLHIRIACTGGHGSLGYEDSNPTIHSGRIANTHILLISRQILYYEDFTYSLNNPLEPNFPSGMVLVCYTILSHQAPLPKTLDMIVLMATDQPVIIPSIPLPHALSTYIPYSCGSKLSTHMPQSLCFLSSRTMHLVISPYGTIMFSTDPYIDPHHCCISFVGHMVLLYKLNSNLIYTSYNTYCFKLQSWLQPLPTTKNYSMANHEGIQCLTPRSLCSPWYPTLDKSTSQSTTDPWPSQDYGYHHLSHLPESYYLIWVSAHDVTMQLHLPICLQLLGPHAWILPKDLSTILNSMRLGSQDIGQTSYPTDYPKCNPTYSHSHVWALVEVGMWLKSYQYHLMSSYPAP